MRYREIGMLHSMLQLDGFSLPGHYMEPHERERYRIEIRNGQLLRSVNPAVSGIPLQTHVYSASNNPVGSYIFVMTGDGTIYAGDEDEVHHHSSFLSGHPVASAGHIMCNNGHIIHIDSLSGHYRPPKDYFDQVIVELRRQGVAVPTNAISYGAFGATSTAVEKQIKKRTTPEGFKNQVKRFFGGGGSNPIIDFPDGVQNGPAIGQHRQGQVLRLYPASKPKWEWF